MVTFMKEQCLLYVTKYISSDTVLEIYETAALLQQNELTTKCWNYTVNNESEIIKHNSVKNVKYETILKIVSEDNLTLQSELDMYNAVIKWGKERFQDQSPEDLRKHVEPLLQQIRFLSMTSTEFAESPCQDGILTDDEQTDIFREIATSKTYDSNNIQDQWRKRREAVKQSVNVKSRDETLTQTLVYNRNRLRNCEKGEGSAVKETSRWIVRILKCHNKRNKRLSNERGGVDSINVSLSRVERRCRIDVSSLPPTSPTTYIRSVPRLFLKRD
ncbi:BTB/POZ domain-containing protein 1-like [Centruroides sculpturatus]|uniref:BTB/POZ domain-containing protein 1-like n=1 Tax=Centruroides sculpturatus TaxID=218467 RepID=UPI000C6D1498|nr:BTB/POZ domain-containing protein 1-like [Centruroides sculpturatus]